MKRMIAGSILVGLLAACSAKVDEDGAEVKINDDAKESVKETWNNAEKEIEKGAEKAKAKLEDAGDAIQEKFAEAKEKVTDDDGAKVEVEVKKD
jgi:vacuolar-type H+-ATPase subunit E/Vma4